MIARKTNRIKNQVRRALVAAGACLAIAPNFVQADVNTGFEFIDDSTGSFTVGEATFNNGQSRTIGVPGLYHNGAYAWMIIGDVIGEVTFSQPGTRVDFWVNISNGVNGQVRVYDTDDNVMGTFSGDGWTNVVVDANANGPFIGRVEIQNQSTSSSFSTSIPVDDFRFVASDVIVESCSVAVEDPVVFNITQGMGRMLPEEQANGFNKLTSGHFIGDSQMMLVAEQSGQVIIVDLADGQQNTLLDVSSDLVALNTGSSDEELGLVSLALHPDFANNGLFYTLTSETVAGTADFALASRDHQSVITEYQVDLPSSLNMQIVANSQREIMRVDQASDTNASGSLEFDANGLLFIGLGAGDNAATSDDNGQNTNVVHGKVLRIDPAGSNGVNGEYGVPADNPFVSGGGLAEVYAYGLNHPSQLSLDNDNGDMYVVDRGQSNIQELNILTRGDNYGASDREGTYGFNRDVSTNGAVVENCDNEIGSTDPLQQYDRDDGEKIIGGYAYQGGELPYLQDRYVFADAAGRLFHMNGEGTVAEIDLLDREGSFGESVTGLARDSAGDIYVMSNASDTMTGQTGKIYKLLPELQITQTDDVSVDEDNSIEIDIIANDDNSVVIDPTSVVVKMPAFSGTTSIDATTGTITYTPNANFNGDDVFSYALSYQKDGATIPESNESMVNITVNAINDAPVATGDSISITQDTSGTITVLSNDTDADGSADIDTGSVTIVDEPSNGSVTLNSSGVATYTPNAGYTGSDSFTYTIADISGTVSTAATVNITVSEEPEPPTDPKSGGGSLGFFSLILGSLALLRRRKLR